MIWFSEKYLREHIKNVHLFKNCARNRKAPNETIKSKTDSSKTVKCNLCGTSFENNRQAAGHRVNCALFLLKSDDVDKVAHPTLTTASDESFVILPVNKNNPIKNPAVDHQTYNCVHCGKVYLKKPSLHCHLLSKHGNAKKPKLSECQVCGKHVLHIAIHMKQVHLYPDVRPHMCDVCGAAFKKTSALQTHRVIHTGVRYPCPVCGRGFTQRGDMRKHAKALHDMDLSANPSNMK